MKTKQYTTCECENVVSVVIRVRNAAAHMQRCLAGLERQILPSSVRLEIIVVDNGSTDESILVARRYGAKIVSVEPDEFTWGRALNMGFARATGQIVLLLSSDTYTSDSNWLCEMLKPFSDSKVAAVYGRQIPYRDAPVDERVRLKRYFPAVSQRFNQNGATVHPTGRGMIASNACAAIRRDAWEALPYDEILAGGEEGPWSYEVLRRGHAIVYQASAKVYHSHSDGPLKQAWRHWELRVKDECLSGSGKRRTVTLRWMASFAKRRLRNCLCPDLPMNVRLKGVAVLPLELMAFAVIDVVPKKRVQLAKLKRLFWG